MLKEDAIAACRYLLKPVIRFLLKNGVTWSEFSELSKDSYVAVARDDYGIQGRPTNNSRVAMLTGLSRREVARVRDLLLDDSDRTQQIKGNRISQILTGWHTDPEFSDNGRPKDLQQTGPAGSMPALLKRYAGDLPHSAIRKEMQHRGLIEELDGNAVRVLKRDYVFAQVDPEIVRQMGVALHDHAATLEHNLDSEQKSGPRFEAMADNHRLSPRAYKAFCRLVETQGLEFLQDIDNWLSENELEADMDTEDPTVRMGVGVYLIYDDIERGIVK